jgi:hypothetical protein
MISNNSVNDNAANVTPNKDKDPNITDTILPVLKDLHDPMVVL